MRKGTRKKSRRNHRRAVHNKNIKCYNKIMTKEANTISREDLIKRIKESEKRFDDVHKNIAKINNQIKVLSEQRGDLEVEAFRLQGEHRVMNALLGDNPQQDPEQLSTNKKDDGNI